MESESVHVLMWINIRVCLPFTLIGITLCCLVRLDVAPVTYYINLLLSNLVQLGAMVALMININEYQLFHPVGLTVFGCGASTSLCFRTIIALERYFLISWPQLHFIRQTKVSVMVSVIIWVFCGVLFPVFISFQQYLFFVIFSFIPAPVFILCLTRAIKSLPTPTSMSAGEKYRIIGSLFLLFFIYFLMILPLIYYFLNFRVNTNLNLFLLSPFMDLMLFFLMYKRLTTCCGVSAAAEPEPLQERETVDNDNIL